MNHVILDTLATGLPYVPVFLGVYMIFRLRDDFDLTIDGSFTMGAVVVAVALQHGVNPVLAMLMAVAASAFCGVITGFLHLTLSIPILLAGLVMSIGLVSVNLTILGTPTVNLDTTRTVLSLLSGNRAPAEGTMIAVLGGFAFVVLAAMALFLRTEKGLALRATGINVRMARSVGINDKALMLLSLTLANGLAGLSGSLVVQSQGYADVNMGTGTLIAGVGAVLLGELLLRPTGSRVVRIMTAVLAGSLLYELILVAALRVGLPAGDLQGVTALTLIVAVAARQSGVRLHSAVGQLWTGRHEALVGKRGTA
jgi:putative ABC transport system permease protein